MMIPEVTIHYRRLPDRVERFRQSVLEETAQYVVTFLESASLAAPLMVDGVVLLEPGASVIWFTYPAAWFDIGCFHQLNGQFTGFYGNILTPIVAKPDGWETTDLCLDVWCGADGRVRLLDEADFEHAIERGWIDGTTAATAKRTAEQMVDAAEKGEWPPLHVRSWTLERARLRLAELRGG